jgi:integrase
MARRGGTKSRPWRASWLDASGTQHTKVFRYKAEAERHEREMRKERQLAAGTLAEWLAGGGEERVMSGLAASTKRTYRGHLHLRIIPDLGDHELRKITPDQIERARDKWLATGLSPAAVVGTMNALARIFRTIRKARMIETNPTREADRPSILVPKKVPTLTPAEVERLAKAATFARPDGINRTVYGDYVRLAAYTSLRAGELAVLAPEDIHLDSNLIWVSRASSAGVRSTTKDKEGRWVIIVEPVRPTLERLLGDHAGAKDEPILRGPFGGKWNHANFLSSVDWPRLVAKLGWPGFRFHDLRGTAISQWIAAGIPLTTVRELAGHASISTTNLYARTPDNALTEAKRLADVHLSQKRPRSSGGPTDKPAF